MLDSEWEDLTDFETQGKSALKQSIDEKYTDQDNFNKIYSEVLPKAISIKNVDEKNKAINFFNSYLKNKKEEIEFERRKKEAKKTGGKKRRTKKSRTKKRRTKKRRKSRRKDKY